MTLRGHAIFGVALTTICVIVYVAAPILVFGYGVGELWSDILFAAHTVAGLLVIVGGTCIEHVVRERRRMRPKLPKAIEL